MSAERKEHRRGAAVDEADARFLRRVLWVMLLAGLVWLLIHLSGLILLAFGAVLVAVMFRSLAEPIARVSPLSPGWALLVAVIAVLAVLGLGGWLFGAQVRAQFEELEATLPRAWAALEAWLGSFALGERLLGQARAWTPSGTGFVRNIGNLAAATLGVAIDLLLVVVAGIYFAAQPRIYRIGLLRLIPPGKRDAARKRSPPPGERCARGFARSSLRWSRSACSRRWACGSSAFPRR